MQTQRHRRTASPESSLLTPGTDLMNSMENILMCYTLQRYQKFGNISIFISGGNHPGEGELKIISWINNHLENCSESILIYGSDSDIVLQVSFIYCTWYIINHVSGIGSK